MQPRFLQIEEILYLHEQEVLRCGHAAGLRDRNLLESACLAPQASLDGVYLLDIFGMAATYINSIVFNHAFIDGNKRTAALAAITFLCFNDYLLAEDRDTELAEQILALVEHKISKEEIRVYLLNHSSRISESDLDEGSS